MDFLKLLIKQIFLFLLTFLLGARTTHAKSELFLSQSNGSSYSQHNLFDVTFSNDFNSFEFTDIQWLPNNVNQSNLEVISQWDNVAYRNTSNAIENGSLQVVKTVSNQLYVKVVNVGSGPNGTF